jgi:hypothetical protein
MHDLDLRRDAVLDDIGGREQGARRLADGGQHGIDHGDDGHDRGDGEQDGADRLIDDATPFPAFSAV